MPAGAGTGERMTTAQRTATGVDDIAQRVAAAFADDVDVNARFPAEVFAELREAGALGILVPERYGGPGATLTEAAAEVATLAEHCGASGLILAMHHIQVASLMRHAPAPTLALVIPGLLGGELLLANANSEIGLHGERRRSVCALEPDGETQRLEKRAATVSYGEYADGVLATARANPDSPANQQVLAVCLPSTFTLEPTGDWDTLGMRGTCSRAALLTAHLPAELILPDYGDIFAATALGASAILLSSVWLGLAEAAAKRAHASVHALTRQSGPPAPGAPPPLRAVRLAELGVVLHQLREIVAGGARLWEHAKDLPDVQEFRFGSHMDNLKVGSSTLAADVVRRAQQICGLGGYQNGKSQSLGRLARDVAAGPLMINNDRTLEAQALLLLIRKEL